MVLKHIMDLYLRSIRNLTFLWAVFFVVFPVSAMKAPCSVQKGEPLSKNGLELNTQHEDALKRSVDRIFSLAYEMSDKLFEKICKQQEKDPVLSTLEKILLHIPLDYKECFSLDFQEDIKSDIEFVQKSLQRIEYDGTYSPEVRNILTSFAEQLEICLSITDQEIVDRVNVQKTSSLHRTVPKKIKNTFVDFLHEDEA